MSRTLRGAWSRRRAMAPLAALAAALVGALTICLASARDAGDPGLAGPLALLGAVALMAPAQAIAAARADEITLARLHGRRGDRLVTDLVAEPLLALGAGGAVGLAVAGAVTGSVLPGAAVLVAVAAAGTATVAVAVAVRLRDPLPDQIAARVGQARPRASSTTATFAGLVALAAAGYAVFAAHQHPAGPRWLLDLGPVLVGLAVGQVLVWLLRGTARAAVARTESAGPTAWLAVRRLARRTGTLVPLGLLVAATVTATVGATASVAAHRWVDQTARLRAGAPVQARLHGVSAARALVLTHRLDPRGRWLMAAAVLPRADGAVGTLLLDSPRLARVSGGVLAGTGAAPVRGLGARLGTGPLPGHGSAALLTGRVSGPRPLVVRLRVEYVTAGDFVASRTLAATPGPRGTIRARIPVPGCAGGCEPTSVSVAGAGADGGILSVRTLDFAGTDLVQVFGRRLATVALAHPPRGLHPAAASRPLPAVAAGRNAGRLRGPDGAERAASVHGVVAALPLVGTHGMLADLGTALLGSLPTSPSTRVLVLARADTPARVLDALPGPAVTLTQVRRQVDAAAGAARARTALLVGLCCLLVAALALLADLGRQRRELARELAALRVVGLDRGRLRPSVRAELLAGGVAAAAGALLGSWLAVDLLLDRLPLLRVPADAVPPDLGPAALLLLAGGAAALLVAVVLLGHGRRLAEPATRPALLREEGLS